MAAKTWNSAFIRQFSPSKLIRSVSRVPIRHKKHAYLSKHKDNPFTRHVNSVYEKSIVTSWFDIFVLSTKDDDNPALVYARDILASATSLDSNTGKLKPIQDSVIKKFDEFVGNCPQRFGLNCETLKSKFEFLLENNIESANAMLIAITIPASLNIRSKNAINIINILLSMDVDLLHVLGNWPLILSIPSSEIENNLTNLKAQGFNNNDITELIHKDPCVISFPLTKDAMSALTRQNTSQNTSIAQHDVELFKKSLTERSTQTISRESINSDIKFLIEFGVSPKQLSHSCLPLLNLSTGKLQETMNFLMNKPLYMELSKIRDFLSTHPTIIVQLSTDEGKNLLNILTETLKNNNNLYRLLNRSPFLFDNPTITINRIALFKQYGFTDPDIAKTLLRCVSLYNNDKQLKNLESKLIFLLNHNDITVADIIQFPSVLRFTISALQCRVGYSRMVNADLLKNHRLSYKYFSPEQEFVERFCKSTLEDYRSFILDNSLKLYRVAVF